MFVIYFDMDTSQESNYEPRFLAVGTGWLQGRLMSALPRRILVISTFSSCCANNKKSSFCRHRAQFKIVH